MDRRRFALSGIAALAGLGGAACTPPGAPAPPGAAPPPGTAASPGGFPLEVANCADTVRLTAAPERIVLLESAPVTTLDGLGVLDRVVCRAGAFPEGYHDDALAARIAAIPALSEDVDASGHLQISQELVIAQRPDLVMGLPDGVTRAGLRDAGAEVLVQEAYCAGGGRASMADLEAQIRVIGRVLGRDEEAEDLVSALQERIAAAAAAPGDLGPRTAVALYPSVGGGPLYAYGAGSMVTAQFDTLGLVNVVEDVAERVVEVGAESLLAADPDLVVVLHQGEDDGAAAIAELEADGQLGALRALREGGVLPLLFNFSEPASPLVVDGLERIRAAAEALA